MNYLANILLKISSLTRRMGKRLSSNKEWIASMKEWQKLNPEKRFRTNYPGLDQNSIVFDLGGYRGQWASNIYSSYRCQIYVFEPHPRYARRIKDRFVKNNDIQIFNFGLGDKDEKLMLNTAEESSSVFGNVAGADSVEISLVTADEYLKANEIDSIDLMKINIEGGEYKLLDHLIQSGWINKIKDLQIQFHDFVPNAEKLMADIQAKLALTHDCTYSYKFFWENWQRKD